MNTPASIATTLAGDTALFASVASTAAPSIRGADMNNDDGCPHIERLAQITKKLSEKDRSRYDDDPNVVGWDGPDDPECPRNWSAPKKLFFTAVTSSVILTVSFGSSVFAPATAVAAAQLGVTLWILGLAAGPVLFGPLSEVFGHLIPFAVATLGLGASQLPVALGGNVWTVLVGRFLAGAFGSGSYAVISGMYYELYEPTPRGVAMAISSTCINLGATAAPIAGAYLTRNPGAGWAWTAWVTLIIAGVLFLMLVIGVPESSSARILERRARRLRLETRNWALHARSEEKPREVGDIARRYLAKPARIFVTEPVLVVFTAYPMLVYGTLYLAFQAFPRAYRRRGWSAEASQLPFLAVALGVASACALCSAFALTWYRTRTEATKTRGKPEPEWRLPPMVLGAAVLPPALLWFGWSGRAHRASQVVSGYFVGCGLQLIFVAGITYVVDVYGQAGDANSAMSAHVVVRSLVASSFPLFADKMYDQLGIAWASSVLAPLSLVMAPAPVLSWVYGAWIRSWSRFSSSKP
ncbi:hypothetical protein DL766_000402 [Monosporascus sp. MC13-8B]|nr:hypothetical protein DL766_000402 [Monosporascus sp. MC13-8B]